MKPILFIYLLFHFCLVANAQTPNDLMLSAQYELTLKPTVQINVGGAIYNKTTNELRSGSQVGNIFLTKEQFATIEAGVPKYLKFEIKKFGALNLRDFVVTNIQTKEQMNGLYDVNQRSYLFGNANGQSNSNCGALSLGVVNGNFNVALDAIDNGQIGFTFIVGCNPVVVAINVTFYFTAKQTTANIAGGTQVAGSWTQSNNATTIKQMLVASRWKTNFWARQGNILQLQPNDFVQFYANGSLDIVLLNLYERGTWKYNATNNTLEITTPSGGTVPYFFKETELNTLRGASFLDEFYFKQVANPNQPVPSSASAKTKSLCLTYWQLNFLQFGLIKVTYRPTDFVRFYANGEYEQALLGIYGKGNWVWQNNESRVVITGTNPVAWDVTAVNNTNLSIKNGADFGELFRAQGVVTNEHDGQNVPETFSELTLYPNPVSDEAFAQVQLTKASKTTFEVFDLLGKKVLVQENWLPEGKTKVKLELPQLRQGIYVVRLRSDNQTVQKTLVVQK